MNEISILLNNITVLRKSHKLSKREMADIMGTSLYTINKSVPNFKKISRTLLKRSAFTFKYLKP